MTDTLRTKIKTCFLVTDPQKDVSAPGTEYIDEDQIIDGEMNKSMNNNQSNTTELEK